MIILTLFFLHIVIASIKDGDMKKIHKDKQLIRPKVLSITNYNFSENSSLLIIENLKSIKYRFEAFGQLFTIVLHQHALNARVGMKSRQIQCHFSGSVTKSGLSEAHFSLCKGMTGVFYWDNKEYFIQPTLLSKDYQGFANPGNELLPHNIYFNEAPFKKPIFSCKLLNDIKTSNYIPDDTFSKSGVLQRIKRRSELYEDENSFPLVDHDVIHEYIIELLVVVTSNMAQRFEKNLKEYILNNIAIATKMLRHPSIKNSIAINVVDIIVLDKDYERMHYLDNWSLLTQDAVVERFCHWVRYKKKHSKYSWDSAVLINDGTFSTYAIGITHLRSMCASNSCIAVVDRGFGTGFILAHEIGHQLNARHDFDDIATCQKYEAKEKDQTYNTMMSTSLYFENYPFKWSHCSEQLINSYLRSEDSFCLRQQNNVSVLFLHDHIYNHHKNFSMGLRYDLNAQCSLAFGEPSENCNSEEHIKTCSTLYCIPKRLGVCLRSQSVLGDGSPCDIDKRCIHGECVESSKKVEPIDGGWSEFTEWSNCSRKCNGGVQLSERFCNNPVPAIGGRYCVGTRVQIKSCNIHNCDHEVDIRTQVCKKLNAKPYIPRVDEETVCRLVCIKNNTVLFHNLSLIDGTPCYNHTFRTDICVNSKCYRTGCDKVLSSDKVLDVCHVCGGKNDTCVRMDGFFDGSKMPQSRGGILVAFKLPKNVTNIYVRKISERYSPFSSEVFDDYQILLLIEHNTVIRRGESVEPFPGGELYYSGSNRKEEIYRINGLIEKEVTVLIRTENPTTTLNVPSIEYHYYVPNQITIINEEYSWRFLKINSSSCYGRCNVELQIKTACFKNSNNVQISEVYCENQERPVDQVKSCSSICGFRWFEPSKVFVESAVKDSCNIRCGEGKMIIQYLCQKKIREKRRIPKWESVVQELCFSSGLSERPWKKVKCVGECHPLLWSYSTWTNCSTTCGTGIRYRTGTCKDINGRLWDEDQCTNNIGMANESEGCTSTSTCKNDTFWALSDWSPCSQSCGSGIQTRVTACLRKSSYEKVTDVLTEKLLENSHQVLDSFCLSFSNKPDTQRPCRVKSCFQWILADGGKCSVTCGVGSKVFNYVCTKFGSSNTVVDDQHCFESENHKPKYITRPCDMGLCFQPKWLVLPWGKCSESCGKGIKLRKIRCGYVTKNNKTSWLRNDAPCRNESRPAVMEYCQEKPCSSWRYGSWSQCLGICLYGNQHRTLECVDEDTNAALPDSACGLKSRLSTEKKCLLFNLCGFWKAGEWSKCSVDCGLGKKTRSVTCHHANGSLSLDSSICRSLSPIQEVYCEAPACKSKPFWWLFKASQCYTYHCDPGEIYSDIRCVNNAFEILPDFMCDDVYHPNYHSQCIKSECRQFSWAAEPWSDIPCSSNSCSMTIRNRKVTCVDEYGNVYDNNQCDKSTKLDNWRLCSSPRNCSNVPRSCKELKLIHPDSADGEYSLAIDLNWTYFIFCANMKTENPTEYLTLKRPNYSTSSKFLSIPNNKTCTFSEEFEESCSDCKSDETLRSITYYTKVRINMTDLSIDIYDNQYSRTIGATYVPYGTAKDCAGSRSCPQGHFTVDLSGTEFSVSTKSVWNELYNNFGYRIVRTKGSQIVKGWCGGECSGCSPLPKLYIEPQIYGRDWDVKSLI